MPFLFGRKKQAKVRRPVRHTNIEERRSRRAEKIFWEKAAEDPSLANAYIRKFLDIDIENHFDPVKRAKQSLDAATINVVLDKIKNDSSLRDRIAEGKIDEIIGEIIPNSGDGEYGYLPGYGNGENDLSRLAEQLDQLDAIQERFGRKKSGFMGIDGETIGQLILALLGAAKNNQGIPGNGGMPQSPQTMYVIEINGKPRPVTESVYRQLMSDGNIKPIAIGQGSEPNPQPPSYTGSNVPQTPEVNSDVKSDDAGYEEALSPTTHQNEEKDVPVVEQNVNQAQMGVDNMLPGNIMDLVNQLNLDDIATASENPPEDYVDTLIDGCNSNDETAQFIYSFLYQVPNDGMLFMLLEQIVDDVKFGPCATSLLLPEGRQWLSQVVKLIKSGYTGSQDENTNPGVDEVIDTGE